MFNTSTSQVRRVQSLVETLDKLKARNANPFSDHNKAVSVTTQWETFENGMGSLSAPPPRASSTQANTGWEQYWVVGKLMYSAAGGKQTFQLSSDPSIASK
jgi:hypothetical protein